ncbi:MAG: hypothetical protein ACPGWR_01055 [Ardenticatenaceae bacterium]
MLTNQEFREFVEDITSQDLSIRVATLKVFWDYPSADERVLPYLERLLNDKTPCLLGHPYIFGEIRWLAAHALAAERAALGIQKPVCLRNVVDPVDTADIIHAEQLANIDGRAGVEGLAESLAILRDMGYLQIYNMHLSDWLDEENKAPAMMMMPSMPALAAV